MELKRLRINGRRLRATLGEMSKIGATPRGGLHRLTLSDEDRQARHLLIKWLKEIKLTVTIDEMGNIFGKRPGKGKDLASLGGSILIRNRTEAV
jgi:N-carbamoyl-L-amino-acid hydrolase